MIAADECPRCQVALAMDMVEVLSSSVSSQSQPISAFTSNGGGEASTDLGRDGGGVSLRRGRRPASLAAWPMAELATANFVG